MAAPTTTGRWVVTLALALAATACGGDGAQDTSTTDPTIPTTTTTTTTTTLPPPTTSSTTTTVPATTTSTTTLAGQPIDFGPEAGAVLGVMAIAHDDVLNFRAGPGTDQEILNRLGALFASFTATGNNRQLPNSIWYEGTVGGVTGWASSAFLAYIGATDDITAAVIDDLGETPVAETMLDLGMIVAEASASTDPASRIRMSVAPTVGNLGEVTFDVVDLGDDAVAGVRLHVFGTPEDEAFSLRTVERTLLCSRGVTADGLCV